MLRPLTCVALGLTFAVAATAAPLPPLSLFGQLPNISTIELSPDGTKWVAAMGDELSAQIQVRAVADNKLLSITQVEKNKLRDVMWVGNNHIISTISTTTAAVGLQGPKREWFLLSMLDLSKDSKWRSMLEAIPNTMNAAVGTPRPFVRDAQPAIVVPVLHFPSNMGLLALAEVRLGR